MPRTVGPGAQTGGTLPGDGRRLATTIVAAAAAASTHAASAMPRSDARVPVRVRLPPTG